MNPLFSHRATSQLLVAGLLVVPFALAAQVLEHLPPVHAWQHDIQDHQIVVPLQAMVQTVHTVGDEVHGC